MNRLVRRLAPPVLCRAIPARPASLAFARRSLATQSGPGSHTNLDTTISNFPTAHDLDPSNKSDYDKYVTYWRKHFQSVEDEFELERGLNHIFSTDWVPSLDVISDALKAARHQNSFATAVRTIEALKSKTHSEKQYKQYIENLKPLMTELGIVEKEDLGAFEHVREKRWWME
ncbi:Cytochrome c oxidase subunit 6 [Thoreauomyces humboldtii]|nr:Cytochrome c oxidase subunit 6 [Thoreauomyces humboldtii]